MLKMNRRGKDVNWSKIVNASPKPKILCLEEDDSDGLFYCPVQICNHDGFSMQRGCRKHIMNKQSWYYYFDKKPDSTQINMLSQWNQQIVKPVIKRLHRIRAGQLSLLILQTTLPRTFFLWLTGSGGGCRSYWEAQPIISKCLKFLKFCCEDKGELTFDMVDFSLCLPNLLFKVVDTMQDDWNLGHAGRK